LWSRDRRSNDRPRDYWRGRRTNRFGHGFRDWSPGRWFRDRRSLQEIFPKGRFNVGNKLSQNWVSLAGCDRGFDVGRWDYFGRGRNGLRSCGTRYNRLGCAGQEAAAQRGFEAGNEFLQNRRFVFRRRLANRWLMNHRLRLGLNWRFGNHRDLFNRRSLDYRCSLFDDRRWHRHRCVV
jgi:hypothetical protein